MSRKLIRQILPVAEATYSQRQMNQFIGTLSQLIDEVRNPLTNIPEVPPSSAANTLVVGDIFEADGVLNIVQGNKAYTGASSATGSVGSVTVTTT